MTISVVVPVYNVERYLPACLQSIRGQSFSDFEVVCVDDGSTDGSGRILDEVAAIDGRLKVLHTDNHGVSHARNLGIKEAMGELMCFVDADDQLMPGALEAISTAFSDNDVDFIKFSGEAFPQELASPWVIDRIHLDDELIEDDVITLAFLRKSGPYPWNGAYRSAFLKDNGIGFPEDLSLGEDQVFSFHTFMKADRVLFSSKPLYRYRVGRKDSAIGLSSDDVVDRFAKHQVIMSKIFDLWTENGMMEGEYAHQLLRYCAIFLLVDICELNDRVGKDRLLSSLKTLLLERFTPDQISDWLEGDGIQEWLLRCCSYSGNPSRFGGLGLYKLLGALYGKRTGINRAKGDLKEYCRGIRDRVLGEPAQSVAKRSEVQARIEEAKKRDDAELDQARRKLDDDVDGSSAGDVQ